MPANAELNIILKVVDEATAGMKKAIENTSSSMEKTSQSLKETASEMRNFGRSVSQVGSTMTYFGAALTAPFILALKVAGQHSRKVADELDRLKSIAENLQITIATVVLPVVSRFGNILLSLLNAFNSLPPATQIMIVQGILMTGVFISLGGIITLVIGKLITLAAGLMKVAGVFLGFAAANMPLLIIAASIAALIVLMWKFKFIAEAVLTPIEISFNIMKTNLLIIKLLFEEVLATITTGIMMVFELLSKLPGSWGKLFDEFHEKSKNVLQSLRSDIDATNMGISSGVQNISNAFQTGTGQWSQNFDNFKTKVGEVVDKIKSIGTTQIDTTRISLEQQKKNVDGMIASGDMLSNALSGAAAQNKEFANAAKAVAMAMAIVHTAAGVTRAFEDYPWPFSMIVGGIIAAAGAIEIATIAATKFHSGGIIRAHGGLAVDEVPIIAQSGEGILSRRGMANLGGEYALNRLNAGEGYGGGDIYVNVYYPKMSSKEEVDALAKILGTQIERELRYARKI